MVTKQKVPRDPNFNCRLCSMRDFARIGFNPDFGLPVYRCAECGFRQTYPVCEEFLATYYTDTYSEDHGRTKNPAYIQFNTDRGIAQREYVDRVTNGHGFTNILDLGAGAGGSLAAYSSDNVQLFGWDPDPQMRQILDKQDRIEIVPPRDIFSNSFERRFDLVILSHVLEHMNDPRAELYRLHNVLEANGLLFIEVPAETEYARDRITEGLRTGLGHLLFFETDTLKQLIETDEMFEVISIEQYGTPIKEFYGKGAPLTFENTNANEDGVWIRCLARRTSTDISKQPHAPIIGSDIDYLTALYELNHHRNASITIARNLYETIRSVTGAAGAKLADSITAIPVTGTADGDVEAAMEMVRSKIDMLEKINALLEQVNAQQIQSLEKPK